jgi:hypothetical protein
METIDALEAVRRLTLERDALANELDAVKDDFRVSLQTLDSIRAATGLHNYGPHLAKSLKTMKDERDALAEQVKRLEGDALQAPVRHERHETGTEPTEGTNGAPRGCGVASCERITRLAADMCATEAALSEANKVLSVWRDRAHEWRKAAKKARAVLVDTHNVVLRGSDFSEPEDWDDR